MKISFTGRANRIVGGVVAAVGSSPLVLVAAEFGGARSTFADSLSAGPLPSVGQLYAAKTIEMCVPNDPICFQGGWDMRAHGAYVQTGMVNDAAAFAASRI